MLKAIKKFFDTQLLPEQKTNNEHSIQLATTALFIEMMLQDGKEQSQEKTSIMKAIQSCFPISNNEVDDLYLLAEQELKQSTDYYQFTQLINSHFSQKEKIKIIENLWHIAYSDSHLDALEEHMVRKIAELIHVPHTQFIRTKLEAKKALH